MYSWLQALTLGLALKGGHWWPGLSNSHGLINHDTLKWVETVRQKYDIPGISLGIIASPNRTGHDWSTETHGFGYMDDHKRDINGDTLFAIASNSKLFVAISIGLLIDNGTRLANGQVFTYNTKIKDIYEDWSLIDPYMSEHLDVLDILSMRSGLPRHDMSYSYGDPESIINRLKYLRPSTEIRQTFQYNNYHYWVLAQIIPRLTGMEYVDYVQKHILDPLDMTSSTYNHTLAENTGHRAESYVRQGKDARQCRETWSSENKLSRNCYGYPFATTWFTKGDGTFIAGPGGLVSSTNDMMKWLKELLEPKVIPEAVIQTTHQSIVPLPVDDPKWDEVGVTTYGHGQMTFNYRGHEVIQHGGDVPGFTSQVTRVPALGVGFFTAINDDDVGGALKPVIVYRILDDLLGLPPIDWEERLVSRAYQKEPSYTPVPEHPRAAPHSDQVIGTYSVKGYDEVEIQDFDDIKFQQDALTPAVLEAVRSAIRSSEGLSEPVYIANFPKVFTAIMAFSHFDGPIYNITFLSLNKGQTEDLVANIGQLSSAVIQEARGIGLFNNFWGGAEHRHTVEEDIEAKCEVWFSKI